MKTPFIATMSIDESAAFDCVDFELMETKLGFYGLDGRRRTWLRSYLRNRSSFVAIGSANMESHRAPYWGLYSYLGRASPDRK